MKKLAVALMILLLIFTGCTPEPTELTAEFLKTAPDALITEYPPPAEGASSFTEAYLRLSAMLIKQNAGKNENAMLSPLSAEMALAILLNGAGGNTRTQLSDLLTDAAILNPGMHSFVSGLTNNKNTRLNTANSIWIRDIEQLTVNDSFLQINARYYNTDIYKAVFNSATVKQMNSWVKKNTDGMIDTAVEKIPPEAMLYLINAVSFDALWQDIYEKDQVREGSFTCYNGNTATVDFMASTENIYLESENAVGFMKKYKDDAYRFAALMPSIDIDSYLTTLDSETLSAMFASARQESVAVKMPKFSFEHTVKLNDMLIASGVTDAFDAKKADLSGMAQMNDGSNLSVSNILHKTSITVDAKGTKAGAITVIEVRNKASMQETSVILDRPFVFMIIDTATQLPVFIGVVKNL